jgi:hypothetical protein
MSLSGSEQINAASSTDQKPTVGKESRRIPRISLPLPVRVEVRVDSDVTWNEVTRLTDVSAFGAGFTLKRPVKRGRLVQLTIPMPRQLRSFDYGEPQYKIWGIVRRCNLAGRNAQTDEYSVGVAFTGKNPPAGFFEHPSRLYDISHRENEGDGLWHVAVANLNADDSELPNALRRHTRFSIPEVLLLERVDDDGNVLQSETTVTENISLGGAAVLTSLKLEAGCFLRVTSERFGTTIFSVVRGARTGDDGLLRLHLEFIDKFFPLEGIE